MKKSLIRICSIFLVVILALLVRYFYPKAELPQQRIVKMGMLVQPDCDWQTTVALYTTEADAFNATHTIMQVQFLTGNASESGIVDTMFTDWGVGEVFSVHCGEVLADEERLAAEKKEAYYMVRKADKYEEYSDEERAGMTMKIPSLTTTGESTGPNIVKFGLVYADDDVYTAYLKGVAAFNATHSGTIRIEMTTSKVEGDDYLGEADYLGELGYFVAVPPYPHTPSQEEITNDLLVAIYHTIGLDSSEVEALETPLN